MDGLVVAVYCVAVRFFFFFFSFFLFFLLKALCSLMTYLFSPHRNLYVFNIDKVLDVEGNQDNNCSVPLAQGATNLASLRMPHGYNCCVAEEVAGKRGTDGIEGWD